MAEYIDRDTVINKRRRMSEYDEAGWCVTCQAVRVEDIENTTSADVVEVVRCRDCKHFITDTFKRTMCNRTFTMFETKPNDYCSYGERRSEE